MNGSAALTGARLVVRLNDAATVKADQLLVSGNLDITGAKLGATPWTTIGSGIDVTPNFPHWERRALPG